jgi:hypothetical protein
MDTQRSTNMMQNETCKIIFNLDDSTLMQIYMHNINLMQNFFAFSNVFMNEIENSNIKVQNFSEFLKNSQDYLNDRGNI